MVVYLERGADLHMAQLMPLPLTVSCFSKIQIGFTFLVPAHPGSPGQRAVKRVCVVVQYLLVPGAIDVSPHHLVSAARHVAQFTEQRLCARHADSHPSQLTGSNLLLVLLSRRVRLIRLQSHIAQRRMMNQ